MHSRQNWTDDAFKPILKNFKFTKIYKVKKKKC